ncbi:MAG: hypothetical protein MK213_03780 [Planctomycetes bacterium]|nr:hypothetical protein [Planctomycetota bacterium]
MIRKILQKKQPKSIWWSCFAVAAMMPLVWMITFSMAAYSVNLWAEIVAYVSFFLPILVFPFLLYSRQSVFQETELKPANETHQKIIPSRSEKMSKQSMAILFFELSLFYVFVFTLISGGIAA